VDSNNEQYLRGLLKSTYKPSLPSIEFKERLLAHLMDEVANFSFHQPLWKQPKLWVPIISACALGATGYGIWLSFNFVPTLLPLAVYLK